MDTEEVVGNEQRLSRACYRNERWLVVMPAHSQLSCARDFAPVGQFSCRHYNVDRVQGRNMLTRSKALVRRSGWEYEMSNGIAICLLGTHFN